MSHYNDIDEVIPPDMAGLDLGMISALMPSREDFLNAAWAGGGVVAGLVVAKAMENMLLRWNVPRFALPFVHAAVGIAAGRAVSGYSPALGAGVVGAFGALAVTRALDTFFNIRIAALSGLEGADLGSFADLLGGTDSILPPELQGLDTVAVEDLRGLSDYGQVSVESVGVGAWMS